MTKSMRIFMLGATGTIGRATLRALSLRGHGIVVFGRRAPDRVVNVEFRKGDVTDTASIASDGFCGERFDAVISCLASRNGASEDAWKVDYRAHSNILAAARTADVGHFVLLSAICVQKPRLAFQYAKLAFESELMQSGIDYSIVRPTAYFKSLSGQIERVRNGKPFLLFGDGTRTACKPISDHDLAEYLVDCIDNPAMRNRILPVGGPGEAITPRQQGEILFDLLGQPPRFRQVPVGMLDTIIGGLNVIGRLLPAATRKAELAQIGRYYATESMLILNEETGAYDAAATPSTGSDSLREHYRRLIEGKIVHERGDHAVF
jgi:divinyl chlorophyllide a 8-vinyl-reductase